jgi:hypothetical protein
LKKVQIFAVTSNSTGGVERFPSFYLRDLIDAVLMPAAFEWRAEPHRDDLFGERSGDDTAADREDVGVVVGTRQATRVQVVAQCGTNARDLICRHLFTLAAAADDDPAVCNAIRNGPRDLGANRRVIDCVVVVRPTIVDIVPEPPQYDDQPPLQLEAGMIRANRDTHGT